MFVLFLFPSEALSATQGGPFAVVELFSSQGCSSCPAAEALFSRLTAWARQNNQPVYPLNFHVDYWNNLGWRDIYSSEAFTERQKSYARIFKDQGIYTPEMIVNGSDAFVGSSQGHLQNDLNQELSVASSARLRIDLTRQKGQITVNYISQGFTSGDVIHFALVERGLNTDVTAGENAGRSLRQDNIVREFLTQPLTGQGRAVLSLDKVSDMAQTSVIAFVQNPQTMLIEAAQQADVDND